MKKLSLIFLAFVLPASLLTSGVLLASSAKHVEMEQAPINPKDKVSLQKGATLFANYCMGCHAAKYMRYERLAEDLDIPIELVQKNFMVTTDLPGAPMTTSMSP